MAKGPFKMKSSPAKLFGRFNARAGVKEGRRMAEEMDQEIIGGSAAGGGGKGGKGKGKGKGRIIGNPRTGGGWNPNPTGFRP